MDILGYQGRWAISEPSPDNHISVTERNPTPTATPTPNPNQEIVFGKLNWDSALVQNGVDRYIVEHGYGYPTSQIKGATLQLFQEVRNGDVDIVREIWLPNQNEIWDQAIDAVEVFSAGKSLEDTWQSTFLIPRYLQDSNPGLDSVEDLKKDGFKMLGEKLKQR